MNPHDQHEDALVDAVMDELMWMKRGDQSAAEACMCIIALVERDVARRLLDDGAVRKALFGFERLERTQGSHPGETYETARRQRRDEMEAAMEAALTHIGISTEDAQ